MFQGDLIMYDFSGKFGAYDKTGCIVQRLGKGSRELQNVRPFCLANFPDMSSLLLVTDSRANHLYLAALPDDVNANFRLERKIQIDDEAETQAPSGVAFKKNGQIVLTHAGNEGNHSVALYCMGSRLNRIRKIGRKTEQPEKGGFCWPRRVAVDQHDRIIICDQGHRFIQIYDKNLVSQLAEFPIFSKPEGLAVDHANNIWVLNERGEVMIFSPDGQFITTNKLAYDGQPPRALAFRSDYGRWVAVSEQKTYCCEYLFDESMYRSIWPTDVTTIFESLSTT